MQKKDKAAAVLTIHNADLMTPKGRRDLEKNVMFLCRRCEQYYSVPPATKECPVCRHNPVKHGDGSR